MRNLWAIYTKELRSYFVSPVAYVIAGVFLFLSGYLFRNILMQFNFWCIQFSQRAQFTQGGMPNLNLNEMVVTQFFGVMDFIWLLVVPMLTMRLLALSAYDEPEYVSGLMDAGADGYITKERPPEMLLEAVRAVADGQGRWFVRRQRPFCLLSGREVCLLPN